MNESEQIMVSSSKILTVSYGTFSCTAEGFDDPLGVIKDTTQFFRGVVGDDRFFGAEPPQFDPELASEYLRDRIADSGGTLSLGSPPRVMAAAASAGAMAAEFNREPVPSTARRSPVQPDPRTEDLLPDDDTIEASAVTIERPEPDAEEPSQEVSLDDTALDWTEAAPAPRASAPDDIAAKLDRIRAVVARVEQAEEVVETPPAPAQETAHDDASWDAMPKETAPADTALGDASLPDDTLETGTPEGDRRAAEPAQDASWDAAPEETVSEDVALREDTPTRETPAEDVVEAELSQDTAWEALSEDVTRTEATFEADTPEEAVLEAQDAQDDLSDFEEAEALTDKTPETEALSTDRDDDAEHQSGDMASEMTQDDTLEALMHDLLVDTDKTEEADQTILANLPEPSDSEEDALDAAVASLLAYNDADNDAGHDLPPVSAA